MMCSIFAILVINPRAVDATVRDPLRWDHYLTRDVVQGKKGAEGGGEDNVLFYTKYTHPTLICRGTDARTHGHTHTRKIFTQYSGITSCSLGSTDNNSPQYTSTIHHNSPQYTTIHHNTPDQYTTIHHNTPQYTTIHHNTPLYTTIHHNTPQYTTIHHNTPQYTTIHHNTPQYTTIHHNTPQYTTIHHN